MRGIIDFHSHVLPGIDDGSRSVEESIGMLKREAEQGITHVIATPHFYPRHDSPEHFLRKRYEAEQILREEMEKHSGLPELSVGAEVYYFSGISDSDILQELTIDGTKSVLLEMPVGKWTSNMYRDMEHISIRQGLNTIVAHVDRYIAPFRTQGIPEKLEQLPVTVQANASFFLTPGTRRMAIRMLRKGQIHLLGSDCHNMSSRKPNLGQALETISGALGADALERIRMYQSEILGD